MAQAINIASRLVAALGFKAAQSLPYYTLLGYANPFGFERYENELDFEDVAISYAGEVLEFYTRDITGKVEGQNQLAPPPLLTFNRAKRLIITPMSGEDIEVVERWNSGQYSIEMVGILVDVENRFYPTEKIEALHQMFAFNNVLELSGLQFTEKDISHGYCQSLNITGVPGFSDTIRYRLQLKATQEANFTLTEPN